MVSNFANVPSEPICPTHWFAALYTIFPGLLFLIPRGSEADLPGAAPELFAGGAKVAFPWPGVAPFEGVEPVIVCCAEVFARALSDLYAKYPPTLSPTRRTRFDELDLRAIYLTYTIPKSVN